MWFRQDLRIKDNPALNYAISMGQVLPIYIHDDTHCKQWKLGEASAWWLHHSLKSLNKSLGGKLELFTGDPLKIIPAILQKAKINTITWNRCYEPWQVARDRKMKDVLLQNNAYVKSFNASLLWEPWDVLKKDGTPYKVFTPYYRRGCLLKASPRVPDTTEKKVVFAQATLNACMLDDLQLLPSFDWASQIASQWQPGEEGAANSLKKFLTHAVRRYKNDRDIPEIYGTSRLSPHLHFGEISPNQVWYAAIGKLAPDTENSHLDCFLSELGWREFSYYLLFHFPFLAEKNFQTKFEKFPWRKDEKALRAWQQGNTGFPIVDAGMRELWQTGYMHNRVRMIVGSFLVKNLLLHWKHGERWFWNCLLDADLASNSASWQWVAGSGADAAPYFRIFNPVLQGEKFDPDGVYVKKYCPELTHLQTKFIHKPWQADRATLESANIRLGTDYPLPITDLKFSRQRALDAFSALKNSL